MLNQFESATYTYKDISEIQKDHDSVIEKHGRLSKELEMLNNEVTKKIEHEQKLRRELAITEKKIKDFEKEVFIMKKKHYEIDEASLLLIREIENKEIKLKDLNISKNNFIKSINNVVENLDAVSKESLPLEEENNRISQNYYNLDKERESISASITRCLSNTSFTREKIENEINDLNMSFMQKIEERGTLSSKLTDEKKSVEQLSISIDDFKKRIISLEELIKIQNESKDIKLLVDKSEKEFNSVEKILSNLRNSRTDKDKQLNIYLLENKKLKDLIASLEKEVKAFQKVLSEADYVKEEWNDSNKKLDTSFEKLNEILTKNKQLEKELKDILEKLNEMNGVLNNL